MAKRIVIVGKCRPKEDENAIEVLVRFASDAQPDEVVCMDRSIRLLEQLREVYEGPIGVHGGEVDARFRATALPDFYDIAPGWLSTAREDGYDVSRTPGRTAWNAAKELNTCVVLGHTGRMAVGSHTTGYGGKVVNQLWFMEVGNLMDKKSSRAVGGQQGFGLLDVDRMYVKPEFVPIIRGRFSVDGNPLVIAATPAGAVPENAPGGLQGLPGQFLTKYPAVTGRS